MENSVDTGPFRDTFLAPYEAAYPNLSHADLVEAARLATRLGWAARAVNGHLPVDESAPSPAGDVPRPSLGPPPVTGPCR